MIKFDVDKSFTKAVLLVLPAVKQRSEKYVDVQGTNERSEYESYAIRTESPSPLGRRAILPPLPSAVLPFTRRSSYTEVLCPT